MVVTSVNVQNKLRSIQMWLGWSEMILHRCTDYKPVVLIHPNRLHTPIQVFILYCNDCAEEQTTLNVYCVLFGLNMSIRPAWRHI